jgi:hypothetical protein
MTDPHSSGGPTRSAGSDRTYCMPGAVVYRHSAHQLPSSCRVHRSQKPEYRRPSSCSTSTACGGSSRRISWATAATVEARNVVAGTAWREEIYAYSDDKATAPATAVHPWRRKSGTPSGSTFSYRAGSSHASAEGDPHGRSAADTPMRRHAETHRHSYVHSQPMPFGLAADLFPTPVDTGRPQVDVRLPPTYAQVVQNRVTPGAGREAATDAPSWTRAGSRPGSQPTPAPRSPEPHASANHGATVSVPAEPCPVDGDPIRAAALEAVEIAAVARHEQPGDAVLTYVLFCAHRQGLTIAELCAASGLDEGFISRLLEEAPAP